MDAILDQVWSYLGSIPNVWLLLVIPVISALVGWGTNVLAIKMTFYPIQKTGVSLEGLVQPVGLPQEIDPVIGWQGIIPAKADKMAARSVDLIVNKLIDIKSQFGKLDPEVIAREMQDDIGRLAREVIQEAMAQELPLLWATLSQKRKNKIIRQAVDEFPQAVREMMEDVSDNILELWDVKQMVINAILKERELLNEIFLRCGAAEFRFIERSGIYFGFLFGCVQMVIWFFIQDYWWAWMALPLGGLLIGWATNYLALKLIFYPYKPINLGFYKVQGLFLKRQREVAAEYAYIVANRLFTVENIFVNVINGPASNRIVQLVEHHLNEAVDKTAGFNRSLIQLTTGTKTYTRIKALASKRFMAALPDSIRRTFDYATATLDVEATLRESMAALPPDDFVGFMHPVFKEDEWKLITIGAILGMFAGVLQLVFLI